MNDFFWEEMCFYNIQTLLRPYISIGHADVDVITKWYTDNNYPIRFVIRSFYAKKT